MRIAIKAFVVVTVFFAVKAALGLWTDQLQPNIESELAVKQLHSGEATQALRSASRIKSEVMFWPCLATSMFALLVFWTEIRQIALRFFRTGAPAAVLLLALTGCRQPYHEAVLVDINTNEVPFLINQEDETTPQNQDAITDSQREDFLASQLVQSRRIEIAHRWKDTGRNQFALVTGWRGKWIPTQRLILVDTSPEVAEWTADVTKGTASKDEGVWVESKDSVGFSTGITLTARIEGHTDAVKFLANYPPRSQREIKAADGKGVLFSVDVTALRDIMDSEIRARVQSIYSAQAAEYDMNELRDMKREIIDAVKEDVIPFFKDRGITITTIGQFGGFTYENPKVQEAIDEVFTAQQDEEVAKAEALAAEQRKVALKLKGEGQAAQILEAARGEAEGIQLVADAKAYELEKMQENPDGYMQLKKIEVEIKRLEVWDGRYPSYLMQTGDDSGQQMMVSLPTATSLDK